MRWSEHEYSISGITEDERVRYGQSIFNDLDKALEYAVVDENREIWAYCTAPKLCGFSWVKQGILVVYVGKDTSVKHWQSSLIKRRETA